MGLQRKKDGSKRAVSDVKARERRVCACSPRDALRSTSRSSKMMMWSGRTRDRRVDGDGAAMWGEEGEHSVCRSTGRCGTQATATETHTQRVTKPERTHCDWANGCVECGAVRAMLPPPCRAPPGRRTVGAGHAECQRTVYRKHSRENSVRPPFSCLTEGVASVWTHDGGAP